MANANVNRLGQINNAGDEKALFLKVFAGEVLASFRETQYHASATPSKNNYFW